MARKKTTSMNVERLARVLVPLFLIGFAGLAYYITTTFDAIPPILKRGILPSDFPQLICGLIVFLTALMVWFDPVAMSEKITRTTWISMTALVLFPVAVAIDLFLALGVFAAALSALWGERRLAALGFVGLVMPAFVFFLFDLVFRIRFPRGLLTNLWYG